MPLTEPILFPFDIDWTDPFEEEREFTTTVQSFDDGSEQRSALAIYPYRRFSYLIKALDQYEAGRVLGHVWGGQMLKWWVPYWPKERYVPAPLSIGATVITTPTAGLGLIVGQGIMLYRSASYAEVVVIASFDATSITFTGTPTTKAWKTSDKMVPVFQGKLSQSLVTRFRDVDLSETSIAFEIEPRLVPAGADTFPVVPVFAPLTALVLDEGQQVTERDMTIIESVGGISTRRSYLPSPLGQHPIHISCTDLTEIDALWALFHNLLGACRPFWLPSYQRDFVPLATILCTDTTFSIQYRGYTELEFPHLNRRQIAFVFADGSVVPKRITTAVNNGDGTETLTMDSPVAGRNFTQRNNNGISYLWYGRLHEDLLRLAWNSHDQATVTLAMQELINPPIGGDTLAQWPVVSHLAAYATSQGQLGSLVGINAQFAGGFGEAGGYAYLHRIFQLAANTAYTVTGMISVDNDPNPFVSGIELEVTGTGDGSFYAPFSPPIDTPFAFSINIITGPDGLVDFKVGRFDLESLVGPTRVRLHSYSFGSTGPCV